MHFRFTLCLGVLFFFALPVQAQSDVLAIALRDAPTDTTASTPNPTDRLAVEVAALRAELDSLRAASTPAPADPFGLRFSGTIFARYGYNTTDTAAQQDFNAFSVDRLYLTLKGRFSDALSFRATTDIVRTEAASAVMLKYAYLDWEAQPWLSLRGGVIQTAWLGYVNKIWGYRGVAKGPADYAKYFSSADVGLSATADLPTQLGEVALHVQNGNGYKHPETDRFKDISGRLVLTPFKASGGALGPFAVAGHAYRGYVEDGTARERWGGLASYDAAAFTLAAGYEARRDGDTRGVGLSAFGTLHLQPLVGLDGVSLFGLVDRYDPDEAADADARLRTVVGAAYQPLSALTLALDYQNVAGESPLFETFDGTPASADASVFLHVIVKY